MAVQQGTGKGTSLKSACWRRRFKGEANKLNMTMRIFDGTEETDAASGQVKCS
jgi:hypothetical protein